MNDSACPTPKVLLVEDDACAALLLRSLLQQDGYVVEHRTDGAAALQVLETQKFDAVVLDLMMPRVDGMQVLKQMRSNPEHLHTPVVLLTAARLKMIEEQAALYRVRAYLAKTETAQLRETLRQIFAEAPTSQGNKLRMAQSADPQSAGTASPSERNRGLGRLFGRKP